MSGTAHDLDDATGDIPWDHLVVGAGSAGSVTAARLVSAGARVLLVEAGGEQPEGGPETNPLRDANRLILEGFNWDHRANLRSSTRWDELVGADGTSGPTASEGRSRALWTRFPYQLGKVVGGSSAVNGAIAMRPLRRDFDTWVAGGNPDWSWDRVLPYYRRIENDADHPGDAAHGDRGAIPVRRPGPADLHELEVAFRAACLRMGVEDLPDLNGGGERGVGPVPANSVDGERIDAATAYLTDVRKLPELELRTGCRVTRVLFEGRRAVGAVLVDDDGHRTAVRARNVILCAGAVGTPVVLQRSGVGDARLTAALGVPVVADLPGVGENLADHPSVVIWSLPGPGVCKPGMPWRQIAARMSSGYDDDVDVQVGLLNNVESTTIPGFVDRLGSPMAVGLSVMLMRPESRGRVFAESADPDTPPVIELGMGTVERDVDRLMHGVRKAWGVLRAPGIAERLERTQFWTDRMIGNEAVLRNGVRNIMNPGWHAVGSARMGPPSDRMSVVDQRGRVHGLEGLRVVDASVFPSVPSVPTNLTTLMLAERIGDDIVAAFKGGIPA
ncbi:GMC family oxidoreductase [Streptomyces sp. CS131]|uniref:GMC family oxidoreductase n=1 Tax=Streptomyces sp. CS131 TaxID=2162711 RepID=UPI000D511155|nr:GMC family oxidoreductase [Streptomyces sp. CS131]PVC79491.1 glucose-methanol-choline oxidoreductase [Streptomyces sp. CS131]